jgi:hypothetical protein
MTNPDGQAKLCREIAPYGKGLVFLAMMILLGSCDFFSTSLASNQVRDPNSIIPPVTVDNIDDLTQAAEGRPDFAGVLLEKIVRVLDETDPGAIEKIAKFQVGGLKAASDASALSQALFDKADVFLSDSSSVEDIFEALQGIAQDVNTSVSGSLQAIAKKSPNTLQASEPEYLMIGAILLIMAEYKEDQTEKIDAIVDEISGIVRDISGIIKDISDGIDASSIGKKIDAIIEKHYPNLVAAIILAGAVKSDVNDSIMELILTNLGLDLSILGLDLNNLGLLGLEEWL